MYTPSIKPSGLALAAVLSSTAVLSSSDRPAFTIRDKAFYADPSVAAFVRPGLILKITGAGVAADGTITVNFTVTDPKGLSLDISGITTPGTITGNVTVAWLPPGQNQYADYLTTPETNQATGLTTQLPANESLTAGQLAGGPGQYTYTFRAKLPAGFNAAATHTVGMWARRDLSDFDLGSYTDDNVFSFVPNGSPVTQIHDEINTQTCNKCHDPLSAHGGPRHSVPLCVLCHVPGAVDADTGNTIDFRVMIHKIHMGQQLPSVMAGRPYQIVGFGGAVTDFSDIVFPADIRTCTFCHEGSQAPPPPSGQPNQGGQGAPAASTSIKTGAPAPEDAGATTGAGTALRSPAGAPCGSAGNPGCDPDLLPWPPQQADNWLRLPSRTACGSCHDNVNFATGENHAGLPQIDDSQCHTCHFVQGELPFDISILGAHTIPQFAPGLPGVVFKIQSVSGMAGGPPTVTYTLTDKSGNPLQPSQMDALSLVMAGPSGDYQNAISDDARSGSTGQNGTYTYTFKEAVPAGASGTWTVGIEGYRSIRLLPGTTTPMVVRDVGFNDVMNFSVDGSPVTPHTVDVTQANCNACHFALSAHGTIRQNVQYCLLCHNPTATDAARRPAAQNPPQGIDFPVLVHRIHLGAEAEPGGQLTPFIIFGFTGSNDFSDVRFPGDLRHCEKCHVNQTQEAPAPNTRIPVTDARDFINPTPPTTAACTACHTTRDASAHASQQSDPALGESCGICHGPGADFDVNKVHARSQ